MRHYPVLCLLLLVCLASEARADSCGCPGGSSRSSQSGRSLCSASLIQNRCSTVALQPGVAARLETSVGDAGALAAALRAAGVEDDPDRLLQLAATHQPDDLKPEERLSVLALVLGLTTSRSPALAQLVAALRTSGAEALAAFSDPAYRTRLREITIGPYAARVSYGCLEISGAGLLAEARVPLSGANDRCDSFR